MLFHFKKKDDTIVTLGTMPLLKLDKKVLRLFVKQYPFHWITF